MPRGVRFLVGARNLGSAVLRVLALLAVWAVLTEGRGEMLAGLPIALAAAVASLAVLPPAGRWRIGLRLLALVPGLFLLSLRAGWDVALRALRPGLPINPGFVDFHLRRPDPAVATAVAYLTTVMPGSLAVDVASDGVRFHVLDHELPVERAAADLEGRLRGSS